MFPWQNGTGGICDHQSKPYRQYWNIFKSERNELPEFKKLAERPQWAAQAVGQRQKYQTESENSMAVMSQKSRIGLWRMWHLWHLWHPWHLWYKWHSWYLWHIWHMWHLYVKNGTCDFYDICGICHIMIFMKYGTYAFYVEFVP